MTRVIEEAPTGPDWQRLEDDVVERIRALAAVMSEAHDAPDELKRKLWTDLVEPNVRLLAEFCVNVEIEDAEPTDQAR